MFSNKYSHYYVPMLYVSNVTFFQFYLLFFFKVKLNSFF